MILVPVIWLEETAVHFELIMNTVRVLPHQDELSLSACLKAYSCYIPTTCIFTILCQNVNVAKRVLNCRFRLTMLWISVRDCVLASLFDCW